MRRRFEEVVQGFGENFLFRTRISLSLSLSLWKEGLWRINLLE